MTLVICDDITIQKYCHFFTLQLIFNQYWSFISQKSELTFIFKKNIDFKGFFLLTQDQKLNTANTLGIETSIQTFFFLNITLMLSPFDGTFPLMHIHLDP